LRRQALRLTRSERRERSDLDTLEASDVPERL
jgi:hypothetical protein